MFRGLASLLLLLGVGASGFYVYGLFTERQALIARQAEELRQRNLVIERLGAATRLAQAMVLDRFTEDGRVKTRLRFAETDEHGNKVASRDVEVEGDTVYFDALVLKFDRQLVGEGDPIKGKSILLFRRIFGEHQKPTEGVALDEGGEGGVPAFYRAPSAGSPSAAEAALWSQFWEFANDPEKAKAAGVRVAQGEAPYTKMEKGKIYNLSLDHAGGLNIVVAPLPAVLIQDDG